MKLLRLMYVNAPIACAVYWSNLHKHDNPFAIFNVSARERTMNLEQVQVIFRHGARTPISNQSIFENFSKIEPVLWEEEKLLTRTTHNDVAYDVKLEDGSTPESLSETEAIGTTNDKMLKGGATSGQLTSVGRKQLRDLGKWLSDEYMVKRQYLSPRYDSKEVYTRSTYMKRTISSLTSLLSGLYEKENRNEPFSIFTKLFKEEDMLPNYSHCANFKKWMYRCFSKPKSDNDPKTTEFNRLIGKPDSAKPDYLMNLSDQIMCREAHGLHIPQYLLDNKAIIIKSSLDELKICLGFKNDTVLRHSVGSLIDTFCSRMVESKESVSEHKLLLYSAHDWTLLSILLVLGVDTEEWPSFASNIIFELYRREDGERFIRVLYNKDPLILDKSSGEEYLSLEKFLKLVDVYRVDDWAKDCGNAI